jgi:hypothetical protein
VFKVSGCPTQPEPIFESRAVYVRHRYRSQRQDAKARKKLKTKLRLRVLKRLCVNLHSEFRKKSKESGKREPLA